MLNRIFFVVPGEPVPKARPRVAMAGGKARAYTPKKSACYERDVYTFCSAAMAGAAPFEGAIALEVHAFFPIPTSYSEKRRLEAIGKWHPKRPDLDNVVKSIMDALNGLAWKDDAQVASIYATKALAYSRLQARVEVTVVSLDAPKRASTAMKDDGSG